MTKKLFKDGALLLLAKLFSIVSGVFITIFVARYYGVNIYGQYTTAIAFSTFILTFTDLGLDTFMLKEAARDYKMLNKYYSNILLIKVLILFLSMILIIFLAKGLEYNKNILILIILLLPNLVINYLINSFFVVMQVTNKLNVNAKIQIIQSICIIIVAVFVVTFKFNIYIYSTLQSSISIILLIIYFFILPVKFIPTFRYTKTLIYGSIFFGLSSLLYIIYYKVDTVMLSIIKGTYDVGIYEAAYKIISVLISLIVIIDNLVMPKFFRLYKSNKIKMISIYEQLLKYGFILGIPFSMLLMYLSKYIIVILYGNQYDDAIIIFQILTWTIVIRLLAAISGFIITASDNMKIKVKFQFIFAIANIIMNLLFIPLIGVSGAAIATVITELMVFFVYYIFVRRKFNAKIQFKIIYKCLIMNIFLSLVLSKCINFITINIIFIIFYIFSIRILFPKEFDFLKTLIFKKIIL